MTEYPKKYKMKCSKCDGIAFEFTWNVESKDHYNQLIFCHDGFGFQFEDAVIKCNKCGSINEDDFEIK